MISKEDLISLICRVAKEDSPELWRELDETIYKLYEDIEEEKSEAIAEAEAGEDF